MNLFIEGIRSIVEQIFLLPDCCTSSAPRCIIQGCIPSSGGHYLKIELCYDVVSFVSQIRVPLLLRRFIVVASIG